MNWQIQIAPLRGVVVGFNYYDTTHEEWYHQETDEYYEHYTFFVFFIAIRLLRYYE